MSPDDKTSSSGKRTRPFAAAGEGVRSLAESNAPAGEVTNVYKGMAAIAAAANGTKPPKLSALQRKLLDRQAALIKIIREQGVSGPGISPDAKAGPAAKLASKSSIQDIAKRVGIWTASGKLSSSYKK
jgi:hypothetical protein